MNTSGEGARCLGCSCEVTTRATVRARNDDSTTVSAAVEDATIRQVKHTPVPAEDTWVSGLDARFHPQKCAAWRDVASSSTTTQARTRQASGREKGAVFTVALC